MKSRSEFLHPKDYPHLPPFILWWPVDKLKALQRVRRNRRDPFLHHVRAVIELRELIERKQG